MGIDFFAHHEEKMRDNPEYKAAYDALEQEFAIANALIQARSEAGMTQKDVAENLGFHIRRSPDGIRQEHFHQGHCLPATPYAPINLSILPHLKLIQSPAPAGGSCFWPPATDKVGSIPPCIG